MLFLCACVILAFLRIFHFGNCITFTNLSSIHRERKTYVPKCSGTRFRFLGTTRTVTVIPRSGPPIEMAVREAAEGEGWGRRKPQVKNVPMIGRLAEQNG